MARVDPKWVRDRKEEIERDEFTSIILSYNPAAQWLITYLANRNRPVKVTNLGAGVKRITLTENVCSVCGGKGYVK